MKTMKIRNLIVLGAAMLGLASCSDDDFLYQDQARVRLAGPKIYTAETDSLNFSFVTSSADATEQQMDLDVYVMGPVADYDRVANFEVDESRTTATGDMYELPTSATVKAGSNHGTLTVTLKRAAVLQEKSVRLYVKVVQSQDFAPGVNEENHLTLIWSDMAVKPSNWSDLEEFFGDYSTVKYRFMLANSDGVTEFDADTMSWALLQSYRIKFQNALNDYNAAHPGAPLTDENGVLVTF